MKYVSYYFILLMDCPLLFGIFFSFLTKATYKRRFVPSYSMAGLSIVFLILALVFSASHFLFICGMFLFATTLVGTGIPLFLAFTKHHHKQNHLFAMERWFLY